MKFDRWQNNDRKIDIPEDKPEDNAASPVVTRQKKMTTMFNSIPQRPAEKSEDSTKEEKEQETPTSTSNGNEPNASACNRIPSTSIVTEKENPADVIKRIKAQLAKEAAESKKKEIEKKTPNSNVKGRNANIFDQMPCTSTAVSVKQCGPLSKIMSSNLPSNKQVIGAQTVTSINTAMPVALNVLERNV